MTDALSTQEWGIPYYWMDAKMRLVQRLNGQTRTGRMIDGRFVPDIDQGDTLHDPCGDM